MAVLNVTDQTFSKETTSGLVLADFFATWCGPCKMIAQVLEELDQDMGNQVKIVKIDVDQNQETANKFGIMSIPTLLVMKDGKVVDTLVGLKFKEAIKEALNNHI
ncbi:MULTISPECIES: thioredoxin [Bacillales]|uniref:thioredoxin n=1 Tax=Bacillales TaxID=1385 RepID=UPI001E5F10C0|nr:thioredoxin [Metabacillus sp. B2-18]UGB30972.1 thioredoxin [Metabacillus sp. B2-18]